MTDTVIRPVRTRQEREAKRVSRIQSTLQAEGICAAGSPLLSTGLCGRPIDHVGTHSNVTAAWANDADPEAYVVGDREGNDVALIHDRWYIVEAPGLRLYGRYDATARRGSRLHFDQGGDDAPGLYFRLYAREVTHVEPARG